MWTTSVGWMEGIDKIAPVLEDSARTTTIMFSHLNYYMAKLIIIFSSLT